jgi:tellurium resistance protein TerD
MGINLQKGQRVSIESNGTSVQKFRIGLGWDTNVSDSGADFDLDASVFVLGENEKTIGDGYFVFYNNLSDPEGAIIHTGDNLTGEGEGDDEMVDVDLSKINPGAKSINIIVTIHDANARGQNFGQVRNAFVRIYDPNTNEEIIKYDLSEDFSIETAVEFGRIYLKDGNWKFEAIGTGFNGGLQSFVDKYIQ